MSAAEGGGLWVGVVRFFKDVGGDEGMRKGCCGCPYMLVSGIVLIVATAWLMDNFPTVAHILGLGR
jgi:hypothetical protein